MNNDQEKLDSLLKRLADPAASLLTPEENRWLEDFRRRYPFFTIPAATRQGEPPLRDILASPSPEAFARMQGNREASRFDDFYPEKKSAPTPRPLPPSMTSSTPTATSRKRRTSCSNG